MERRPVRHPVQVPQEHRPVRCRVEVPGSVEVKPDEWWGNGYLVSKTSKNQASKLFKDILHPDRQSALDEAVQSGRLYQSAFQYKGHILSKASVLQMAMWMEATCYQGDTYTGLTSKLVEAGVDMRLRAEYVEHEKGKTHTVSLHSIVIASGLGKVELLDALAKGINGLKLQEFLNQEDLATKDGKYYYSPLHDACFFGRPQAVMWLLERGARADKPNADGLMCLHLYVQAESCGSTVGEKDMESALKKLVEKGSPLTAKAKYGQVQLTPLEMTTQHDSHFPTTLVYLLAPAFNQLTPGKLKSDVPLKKASIFEDLVLLARTSPKHADELAKQVLTDESQRNLVRDQLVEEVQNDRNAVLKLAGVMCGAPKAATEILATLTRPPRIQDPTHYPLRNRTSLTSWSTLGKAVNLRGVYSADALRNDNRILEPTWFYNTSLRRPPSWHDKLIRRVDDLHDRVNLYDVQTSVIMVPNLLTVDMMKALSNVEDIDVFNKKTVTGMVTCLWSNFAQIVNAFDILFYVIFEILPLMGWGLSVGKDGEVFGRLWHASADEKHDLSYNSPAGVPVIWSILAGVWLKTTIEVFFWIGSYAYRWYLSQGRDPFPWSGCFNAYLPRLHGRDTNTGIWPIGIGQFLDSHVLLLTLLEISLLGILLWRTAGFNGCYDDNDDKGTHCQTISYDEQALLAANIFLRVLRLLYKMRTFAAWGPRVIAIADTFVSPTMLQMLFIMFLCFFAFMWILLSLRRQHTFGWEGIYLYRGLVFGDGDGLDRLGLNSENKKAYNAEGDNKQHSVTTFYGVIFTIVFNIVFMNLIIAIYGDEYNAQQQDAPLLFLRTRTRTMVRFMLKYHSLREVLPFALNYHAWIELFLFWLFTLFVTHSKPCYQTCFGSAFFFAAWQLHFFVLIAHHEYHPHSVHVKKTGAVCHVRSAELASDTMLEVKVSIERDRGHLGDWRTALKNTAKLSADSVQFDGFRPLPCLAKGSLIVFDDHINSNGAYEATLGFPLETHHGHELTLSFKTPTGEPGSVQFHLPRFVWMCYRDDFNEMRHTKKAAS